FVAVFKPNDPKLSDSSYDNMKAHRWGPEASNSEATYWPEWHSDQLDDRDYRSSLYAILLAAAVNRTVLDHTPRTAPLPAQAPRPPVGAVSPVPPPRPPQAGQPLSVNDLPVRPGQAGLPAHPDQAPASPPALPPAARI